MTPLQVEDLWSGAARVGDDRELFSHKSRFRSSEIPNLISIEVAEVVVVSLLRQ